MRTSGGEISTTTNGATKMATTSISNGAHKNGDTSTNGTHKNGVASTNGACPAYGNTVADADDNDKEAHGAAVDVSDVTINPSA